MFPNLIAQLKHIPVNVASTYGGLLLTVYAIVQFFCAPIIGNLSDRYGRRPILLLSLFGFGVDYIILALAPSYGWLFIGQGAIAGRIYGGEFYNRFGLYCRSEYRRNHASQEFRDGGRGIRSGFCHRAGAGAACWLSGASGRPFMERRCCVC